LRGRLEAGEGKGEGRYGKEGRGKGKGRGKGRGEGRKGKGRTGETEEIGDKCYFQHFLALQSGPFLLRQCSYRQRRMKKGFKPSRT